MRTSIRSLFFLLIFFTGMVLPSNFRNTAYAWSACTILSGTDCSNTPTCYWTPDACITHDHDIADTQGCWNTANCHTGSICTQDGTGTEGVCQASGNNGGGTTPPGYACTNSSECQSPNTCNPGPYGQACCPQGQIYGGQNNGQPFCINAPASGTCSGSNCAACLPTQCGVGAQSGGGCGWLKTTNSCQPTNRGAGNGETCYYDSQCQSNSCSTHGGPGGICVNGTASNSDSDCHNGHNCDTSAVPSPVCVLPKNGIPSVGLCQIKGTINIGDSCVDPGGVDKLSACAPNALCKNHVCTSILSPTLTGAAGGSSLHMFLRDATTGQLISGATMKAKNTATGQTVDAQPATSGEYIAKSLTTGTSYTACVYAAPGYTVDPTPSCAGTVTMDGKIDKQINLSLSNASGSTTPSAPPSPSTGGCSAGQSNPHYVPSETTSACIAADSCGISTCTPSPTQPPTPASATPTETKFPSATSSVTVSPSPTPPGIPDCDARTCDSCVPIPNSCGANNGTQVCHFDHMQNGSTSCNPHSDNAIQCSQNNCSTGFACDNNLCVNQPTATPTQSPSPSPAPSNSSTPPPPGTITPTPTIADTILSFAISLDGIGNAGDHASPINSNGSNKNPVHTIVPFSLDVIGQSGTVSTTGSTNTLTYDANSGLYKGTVTLHLLQQGNYTIKITVPKYLKKIIYDNAALALGTTVQLPQVNLTTGDINNDNRIDILDYNIFLSCSTFGRDNRAACGNLSSTADLNDDGKVDQLDYNLFIRELPAQRGD